MVSAYAQMHMATGEKKYYDSAIKLLSFLQNKFMGKDGVSFFRTYMEGTAAHAATLRDYAFFIRAMLDVFHISFENKWLKKAGEMAGFVFQNFREKGAPLFNFSQKNKTGIIYGRKDFQDDEMPSGNAMMLRNLQDLGILLGREDWRKYAANMLVAMQPKTESNPLAFAAWADGFLAETNGVMEVAIVGEKAMEWGRQIQKSYVPYKVLMAATDGNNDFPLLKGKSKTEKTLVYVCKNHACQRPMESVAEFENGFARKRILKY